TTTSESDSDKGGNLMSPHRLLQIAVAVSGAAFLLIYPLAIVWPSGWAWHVGAPYESQYFMMIVGVYLTLGVFLLNAARNPQAHRSLIWFTVWSSLVHAGIMAVQSMSEVTLVRPSEKSRASDGASRGSRRKWSPGPQPPESGLSVRTR